MADRPRRILGVLLGAVMLFLYTLVAQYINVLALSGLPLYAPEPGRLVTVLWSIVLGGLLGMLAAWPEEAIPGVIVSTLVGSTIATMASLWENVDSSVFANAVAVLFITFLPRTVLYLPMAALVRWSLHVWSGELLKETYSLRRLGFNALLMVALAGGTGAFSLYSDVGRGALQSTHQLIQLANGARSRQELPKPLQSVESFLQFAQGPYSLELSDNPDVLPVQRPIASFGTEEYAVFVRYENGFRFGCSVVGDSPPYCGNY